jgi:hypothetical protein
MNELQSLENQVVKYNDGEIELEISIDNETVWLNRHQLAELFDKDILTTRQKINFLKQNEE